MWEITFGSSTKTVSIVSSPLNSSTHRSLSFVSRRCKCYSHSTRVDVIRARKEAEQHQTNGEQKMLIKRILRKRKLGPAGPARSHCREIRKRAPLFLVKPPQAFTIYLVLVYTSYGSFCHRLGGGRVVLTIRQRNYCSP